MSCDEGEVTEMLENELILQHFRHFTYVTTHSPTLLFLHLRHSSFSNPSFASPYVTSSSLNSPGEPPMVQMTEADVSYCIFRHTITTLCPLVRMPVRLSGEGSDRRNCLWTVVIELVTVKKLSTFISIASIKLINSDRVSSHRIPSSGRSVGKKVS